MLRLNKELSYYLNLFRWMAALVVLWSHLVDLIFVRLEQIHNKNLLLELFYFISSLGHEAVIVFFVLSGYLVGGKLFYEIKNNTFIWKNYLIKRMTRLYIVLLPALVIGFVFDFIGISFFNDSKIYNHIYQLSSLNYDVESRLIFETFFINLFMLQGTIGTTFGSNGPLWSLAYEFWYYLIFPILLLCFFEKILYKKFLYILTLSIILYFINNQIIIYFMIWLLGAIVFNIKKIKPNVYLSIGILFIILILIKKDFFIFTKVADISLALSLCMIFLSLEGNKFKTRYEKANTFFADFSFSLYLFHYPFILLIISFLSNKYSIGLNMQPNSLSFLIFTLISIITIICSILFYFLFEKRTNKVKKILFNKLG